MTMVQDYYNNIVIYLKVWDCLKETTIFKFLMIVSHAFMPQGKYHYSYERLIEITFE